MTKKHTHEADSQEDDARVARVREVVEPVLLRFGIAQQYGIQVCFSDGIKVNHPLGKGRHVTARVKDEWPYRTMVIELNRKYLDASSDEMLCKTFIHEVLHPVVFGDIRRFVEDLPDCNADAFEILEESAVDLLSIWLSRLWGDAMTLKIEKQVPSIVAAEERKLRQKKA